MGNLISSSLIQTYFTTKECPIHFISRFSLQIGFLQTEPILCFVIPWKITNFFCLPGVFFRKLFSQTNSVSTNNLCLHKQPLSSQTTSIFFNSYLNKGLHSACEVFHGYCCLRCFIGLVYLALGRPFLLFSS